MVALSKSRVPNQPDDFARDPRLLNTPSGTLVLRAHQILKIRGGFLSKSQGINSSA